MKQPSDADRLIRIVRDAEGPSKADEERVLRRVKGALPVLFAPSPPAPEVPEGGGASSLPGGSATPNGTSGLQTVVAKVAGASTVTKAGSLLLVAAVGGATTFSLLSNIPEAAAPVRSRPAAPITPPDGTARNEDQETEAPIEVIPAPVATPGRPPTGAPPLPTPERTGHPRRPSLEKSKTTHGAPLANNVQEELAVLEKAQRAIATGAPEDALRTLQTVDPAHTLLAEERHAVQIAALCQLGRLEEANRSARRFRQSFPGSIHWGVVTRACKNL